jgi:RNA polymerase sigma-70 factor (ECF subfamily)
MPPNHSRLDEVERLYRQYGASLVLFAATITGERGRAQDAVHHIFLKLIEDGSLRNVRDPKAYLYACVRNTILNDSKLRQRSVALDSHPAWFNPPSKDYAAELNLQRALRALPDDQRQVTVLHIWGELTFAQIADVLGVSSNTAASRYRYALVKLREEMCVKEDFRAKS